MHEAFIADGSLKSYDQWRFFVESLKERSLCRFSSESEAVDAVATAIKKAILQRVPSEPFGVLFSAGLDSALIAHILSTEGLKFTCYTVGFEQEGFGAPQDLKVALEAAARLGLDLKTKSLDLRQAERLFKSTSLALAESASILGLGVGAVEVACVEMAKMDGVTRLYGGLGSEEVFGGYHRHKQSINLDAECWQGLVTMHQRDLVRDFKIARHFGIEWITPFMDENVLVTAMRVPASLKIVGGQEKYVLRKAALELGLDRELALRPKKAAQYGSKLDKALEKLSQARGLSKAEFVDSLKV